MPLDRFRFLAGETAQARPLFFDFLLSQSGFVLRIGSWS